jgi:hypothetical protein
LSLVVILKLLRIDDQASPVLKWHGHSGRTDVDVLAIICGFKFIRVKLLHQLSHLMFFLGQVAIVEAAPCTILAKEPTTMLRSIFGWFKVHSGPKHAGFLSLLRSSCICLRLQLSTRLNSSVAKASEDTVKLGAAAASSPDTATALVKQVLNVGNDLLPSLPGVGVELIRQEQLGGARRAAAAAHELTVVALLGIVVIFATADVGN